ncbi:MAG TPA: DUF2269 family protein [Candidatus Baltobacteraceae bacterium]|nr:DUF2269 family protein [Candidatus Baltobacteraceae bacterium]
MKVLETLHVAAAVLWLGNFAVTGVWALRAALTRQAGVFAFAAREIVFTDIVFTLVFGTAVVTSGLELGRMEHLDVLQLFWTRTALTIVGVSAIVWLALLLPLEVAMLRAAAAGIRKSRLFAAWNAVGWLLTLALFFVIYLMIAKPV